MHAECCFNCLSVGELDKFEVEIIPNPLRVYSSMKVWRYLRDYIYMAVKILPSLSVIKL